MVALREMMVKRNGYQNNGYNRTNGNAGGYNYDDRPNNYSQRSSSARPSNPQPPVEPENDYAPGDDGNDIPFLINGGRYDCDRN